jgi:hypothetical protein
MEEIRLEPQIPLKFTEEPSNFHYCLECNTWTTTKQSKDKVICKQCGSDTKCVDRYIIQNICILAIKLELDKTINTFSKTGDSLILKWVVKNRVKRIIKSLIGVNSSLRIYIIKPRKWQRIIKEISYLWKYYHWKQIIFEIGILSDRIIFTYTNIENNWVVTFKEEE